MDDNGKYLRLFGTLFFTFIGTVLGLAILFLLVRLLFGALSFIPGINDLYTICILSVPAAVFVSVYLVYARRTGRHASVPARIFSYICFAIILGAWLVIYVTDFVRFIRFRYADIENYNSFNMAFLVANVVVLFLVAMIQAFTKPPEKDWMDGNPR